jgi:hypothetical protein
MGRGLTFAPLDCLNISWEAHWEQAEKRTYIMSRSHHM